jgi:NADH-quinone oxidoreductase subunit N
VGVFTAAIRAGHTPLALIGVVSSVVAAFFYLRVIVLMYMQEPQGSFEEDHALMPRVAIAIPAILTLVLGIFPGLIVGILERASILRW